MSLRTFYVVRHAKAGDREEWSGDDRLRPLTKKGHRQAEGLVDLFASFSVKAVFSSPYARCVQTVEPLARARRLAVTQMSALAEGHGLNGLGELLGDTKLDGAVVCTHGDVVWELVEDLLARDVVSAVDGGYDKGSTWVLGVDRDGIPERARYLSPA